MANSNTIKKIKQFRYYGINFEQNEPVNDLLWLTDLLKDYGPITKLGIQAPPGTKFYTSNNLGIIIDHTGIYEIDLRDTTTTISTLYFDADSLINVDNMPNGSIIVDILYSSTEGMVN